MKTVTRRIALLPGLAFVLMAFASYSFAQDDNTGIFTDSRDDNVYKWVKIGNQIWMAENLRFRPDSGSYCWEYKEENCGVRGRLYDWQTAMQVSPPGWHLPSDKEWKELEIFL